MFGLWCWGWKKALCMDLRILIELCDFKLQSEDLYWWVQETTDLSVTFYLDSHYLRGPSRNFNLSSSCVYYNGGAYCSAQGEPRTALWSPSVPHLLWGMGVRSGSAASVFACVASEMLREPAHIFYKTLSSSVCL